ncbi:hypothetical protein GLOIN_2v1471680 [Rhizophagus clarus]|uniref:Uncharacterized protein n=1 Tax=Rhizophagus clarus TaxID=94130 RepID=A0A8H3QZX5_9GLOM|nr:hypothetical protein GLOIN_2v1471680 [Rhizophagus clarus]
MDAHNHITPKQKPTSKKSPQQANRKRPMRPPLKQLLVRFEKESAIKYLYENEHWTLVIGNSLIRILHPDIAHEISAQRTSYRYLIRGLPLNTDIRDMIPILKAIKGRTCTFNATSRNSISKTAFVYTNKDNYTKEPNKIQKAVLQNHNIFIVAQDYKDRTKLENNQDINNKYRHIISPERKTKPIPPITTSLNQNGKRSIVPTNSNNYPNVNANARTLKQQPSIQPHLNAMHEKQLTEANDKIAKLENALNALSTKYKMLEQQIKMIYIQHNTQNTSIDNLKQNFSKITKQVDDYQTTQLTINNKLDFIIEKISKNSPTPSHHSTYSHKTPYKHIAKKQYNDDSLYLTNLSKYQEIVPEMDIDYNQHQQEETETHYSTSSQLDYKSGYGPTNPKSDTDTDNHTIDAVVHPSELPIDSNHSGIFGLPSFF